MKAQHLQQLDADIEEMEARLNRTTANATPIKTSEEEDISVEEDDISESSGESESDQAEDEPEDYSENESTDDVTSKPKKRTDWKKRYTSLRTHYDSKVFELRSENSQLRDNLLTIKKHNEELLKKLEGYSDTSEDLSFLTDEQREILGEDAVDALVKATKASVKPLREQLEEERKIRLRAEEEEVNRSRREAQRLFVERLERLVPYYGDIDTDPKFLEWMEREDEWSGVKRKTLFQKAVVGGDIGRAAEFYAEFYNKKREKKPSLDDLVTPTGTNGSPTRTPQVKENETVISMASINKFYDDVVRGKYKGRLAEQQKIEREIEKAVAERRVRK